MEPCPQTSRKARLYSYCLLFVFFFLLYVMIDRSCSTDFHGHRQILSDFLEHNTFPVPPLYFAVLLLLGTVFHYLAALLLALAEKQHMAEAAGFALGTYTIVAGATVLKFYFARKIFLQIFDKPALNLRTKRLMEISIMALMFAHPIALFSERMYIGYVAANVWHNSTTILLMPFALWLFSLTIRWFKDDQVSHGLSLQITALCVLNILIKPSYCFAFLPVFFLLALKKYRFTPKFYYSAVIVLFGCLMVLIEYIIIYYSTTGFETQGYTGTSSSVIIKPFGVWYSYAGFLMPLKLLLSVLFPVSVFCAYASRLKHDSGFLFAAASLFVALLIFIGFAESGPRFFDGNFSWQLIPANFILFLCCTAAWFKYGHAQLSRFTKFMLCATFCAHTIWGIAYVIRIIVHGTYA